VEYRPERFSFAANNLISETGEHWVALGLSSSDECPAGLVLEPDEWEFEVNVLLGDLGPTAISFPLQFCSQSQNPPPGVTESQMAMARVADRLGVQSIGANFYQDDGISCMGPVAMDLGNSFTGEWYVFGTAGAAVTRTQIISLEYTLQNDTASSINVNFAFDSDLDVDWALFDDPEGTHPIPTAVPVPDSDAKSVFLIGQNPISASQDAGQYIVDITASSGATSYDLSSLIWVAEWVAPPTPVPSGDTSVYLPALMKPR
jgi:hypothetical protein